MSPQKKIIGISLRVVKNQQYEEYRDALSHDWINLFNKLNINPVLIPNKIQNVESFLNDMKVNGLILSGGDNLGDNTIRDQTEQQILTYSCKNKIPLVGICRGMQAINDYFGGKLETLDNESHIKQSHNITISQSSSSIFKTKKFKVNSYHHNIIKPNLLAKNLSPFALADDDTIEGFFHLDFPLYGIMWHPERNFDKNSELIFRKIFYDDKFL